MSNVELRITLSRRGAEALRAIHSQVSGSPKGPRSVSEILYDALTEAMGIDEYTRKSHEINCKYIEPDAILGVHMVNDWPEDDCEIEILS